MAVITDDTLHTLDDDDFGAWLAWEAAACVTELPSEDEVNDYLSDLEARE